MRLLFYAEGPCNTTGFSLVNRHIAQALSEVEGLSLEWVATSHWHEPRGEPYTIHACPHGPDKEHARNLEKIRERIASREWDVFFYQGDMGTNDDVLIEVIKITHDSREKRFIYYIPLDIDECLPQSFDIASAANVPVFYTMRAVQVTERIRPELAGRLSSIGLGTEPDIFYPLGEEERKIQRKRIFDIDDDTFIVINVNRNQQRKDLARSMAYFHKFHELHPHSMLYLHSVIQDAGGNLMVQAAMAGCDIAAKPAEVAFSGLQLHQPWSQADMNNLYNAADCLISTSYGEGWGLTTAEAMCAGCPVVVPANTANFDLVGEDEERGYLAATGGDLDHTVYHYETGGSPHDMVHLDSFLTKITQVYLYPGIAKLKAEKARQWCLEHTWQKRGEEWQQLMRLLMQQS